MNKHHPFSPSKYPAWAECPMFLQEEKSSAPEANMGIQAHEEIGLALSNDKYYPSNSAAAWAEDTILSMAQEHGATQIENEISLVGVAPGVEGITGTADVRWTGKNGVRCYVDFKTFSDGSINYMPQLDGYAALDASPKQDTPVKLIVLHGGVRQVECIDTTSWECLKRTVELLTRVKEYSGTPNICKWCQYCGRRMECPSVNSAVATVSSGMPLFQNMSICQKLVVLDALDKISKSIRNEAKKKAEENGGVLEMDGIRYEMKPWKGPSVCRDIREVASAVCSNTLKIAHKTRNGEEMCDVVGLDPEKLLAICKLSKSNLVKALKDVNGSSSLTSADIDRFVSNYFESTDGEAHFIRVQ